ncbi:thiol-disulfide interchange protein [Paracoccus sp. S4493]|jgi:thiol-disulfide isomerase/thioredoxin|uniref:TlpA family protein disulfide reductase n=1 Tax=Paracoccus sp. S4493 TaxID=579490 RepID=UPI0005F9FE3F|nr:TlpA disulfide reductase family protein [Paracoccus sp. S4493]KJZ28265.1 thiol-disulfide interchange protein [Paracoccus sp. S4493]
MMRRAVLTGALVLAAAPASARVPLRLHDVPRSMLSTSFVDQQGRKLALADFRGQIVLLNIWATWCPPCIDEMPALDRLQVRLDDSGFHVLALSIDERMAEVRRFYDNLGIRHLEPYLAQKSRVMADIAAVGLPTTILIDRGGRERGRLVGPAEWDGRAAIRLIQSLNEERNLSQ